ncbi:MAG: 50S ribosomal protein L21e [Candidatus Bathyarchaeia archaeon]
MRRSKGYRSGTRQLLRLKPRNRGTRPLTPLLINHAAGEKVLIRIHPSQHKGQPHRRYHGKIGFVTEKRGRAFVVKVQDGGKIRKITVLPDHLEKRPAEG